MKMAQKAIDALELDMQIQDIFRYQFCLKKSPDLCPNGWVKKAFEGWSLLHCKELRCVQIQDKFGVHIGYLLGVAITSDGVALQAQHSILLGCGNVGFWGAIDEFVNELCGRFIIFLSDGVSQRIYFDPVMDQSCVFDEKSSIVASSLLLSLDQNLVPNEGFDIQETLRKRLNFSFCHTPDSSIKRAIPNHYLDLRTFKLVRHWPRSDLDFSDGGVILRDVAEEIVWKLGRNLRALVKYEDCDVPLSGGLDSRNLIACLGPDVDEIGRVYSFRTNQNTAFDVLSAMEVARSRDFEIDVIDIFAPNYEDQFDPVLVSSRQKAFFLASGLSHVPISPVDLAANFVSAKKRLNIRGNIMDMIGGNQFKRLKDTSGVNVSHGLGRLAICDLADEARVQYWGGKYLSWVEGLPENAQERVYDFAFMEQLLPNTLGGRGLIGLNDCFRMNAFSDRRLIHLAASVNPRARRKGRLNAAILKIAAPDLLEIPFTNQMRKDKTWRRKMRRSFHKPKFFTGDPAMEYWGMVRSALC